MVGGFAVIQRHHNRGVPEQLQYCPWVANFANPGAERMAQGVPDARLFEAPNRRTFLSAE